MPSLILTGHPCVGKTTFAHLLAARALRHPSNIIARVVHIRESTSRPDRTKAECYSDSHAEKTTRAALKSEFDRAVTSKSIKDGGSGCGGSGRGGSGDDKEEGGNNTLVILDSLNYIKGYRYELYCISKAAGERHGVVWITGDGGSDYGDRSTAGRNPGDELAKRRNRERRELQINRQKQTTTAAATAENEIDLDGYFEDDGTMDDLVLRYEPPDRKNRWENPLYKVDVTSVLPWGKDGTTTTTTTTTSSSGDVASDPDAPASHAENKNDERGEPQSSTGRTKETKGRDSSAPSSAAAADGAPKRPAKKSSSGFKRRGKKSAQRASSSSSSPATTTRVVAPAAPANHVPSSMASRNLASDTDAPNDDDDDNDDNCEGSGGGKRKMEEVIDGMLDSFLTNVAPLQEGMSTFKNVSSESNMLNQMDDLTRRVNNEILKGQKAASLSAGAGGRIFVALSNDGDGGGDDDDVGTRRRAVNLSKPLHGNELRGFRRQFLKWIAGHPMPVGTKEGEMAEGYLAYIESHI